jgi:hypothetical protein
VWTARIKDVTKEMCVANFLPNHSNGLKRAKYIERLFNLIEVLVANEKRFELSDCYH